MDTILSVQNQNYSGDGKECTKVSRAVGKAEVIETIHWSLENLVKIYHGIIGLLHGTDLRRMVLLKERYAELRKGLQTCCYNPAWMKNGGLVLWNATCICERLKISWHM